MSLVLARVAGLQDDVLKLLDVFEPAERAHRQLVQLARFHRLLTDLPHGRLHVLILNRPDHVVRAQVHRRHFVGIEPDALAVVALAEVGNVAHAVDPQQLVLDLDRRVVAQVEIVITSVGRNEVDAQQDAGRLLLHGHALQLDLLRQQGRGQRDAILHQHLGHVQVGAQAQK